MSEDMNELVHEQQNDINEMEQHVEQTVTNLERGNEKLKQAEKDQKKSRICLIQ